MLYLARKMPCNILYYKALYIFSVIPLGLEPRTHTLKGTGPLSCREKFITDEKLIYIERAYLRVFSGQVLTEVLTGKAI